MARMETWQTNEEAMSLRDYVQHKEDCIRVVTHPSEPPYYCSCGLDAALEAEREGPQICASCGKKHWSFYGCFEAERGTPAEPQKELQKQRDEAVAAVQRAVIAEDKVKKLERDLDVVLNYNRILEDNLRLATTPQESRKRIEICLGCRKPVEQDCGCPAGTGWIDRPTTPQEPEK